jgi:aminopeptidase YwaD
MVTDILSRVALEASAERAYDHLVSICRFHRIQASPGYRAASEYCVDRRLGVSENARVIHYPADPAVRFWHLPSFEEWSAKQGILEIAGIPGLPSNLADYQSCPISLVQRSKATQPGGVSTEVVHVGQGASLKDYHRARGKIAICDAHCPRDVYDAAAKAGAAGIILYRHRPIPGLRTGNGVPGVRQYNSFWWNENELFGFVLTPEDGQQIVSYLQTAEGRAKPPRAWALVESESYPGSLEVVTSLIPGREAKEILIIAHLCHPKPSAGDNASGVAVALETHRVIAHLVDKGILPQPRYGIRFLLVPEMTGTLAFLSRERGLSRRLLLGLNLDMVGQDQGITGATLCIESPPLAAPSFTPYLLETIAKEAFARSSNPAGTGDLLSIRMQTTPFSGGSDHYILSDPTVGIPTPMLMQWPDKYYHTSGDTIDKVSPDVMRRMVIASAVYAYTCALASEEDLIWTAGITGRGVRKWVIDEIGKFSAAMRPNAWTLGDKAEFLMDRGKEALRSIRRLLPLSKGLRARIKAEERALTRCVKSEVGVVPAKVRRGAGGSVSSKLGRHTRAVYRRTLPGPVDIGALLMDLSPRWKVRHRRWLAREKTAYVTQPMVLYWMDGRRTSEEVCSLIALETGHCNPEFLAFHMDLLEEAGVIEPVKG